MTIWPNSLNLGLGLKIFPAISDFFLIFLPFGALYIMVVLGVGGLAKPFEYHKSSKKLLRDVERRNTRLESIMFMDYAETYNVTCQS